MSHHRLEDFRAADKRGIGAGLPQGAGALADALRAGADAFGLTQQARDTHVCWVDEEGEIALMFCVVPDPRNLDRVLGCFTLAQSENARLAAIFVHQWTDGEGNWDVFPVSPRTGLQHADRIYGADAVQEKGPALREDVYTLFSSEQELPPPGAEEWIRLLAGPIEGVAAAL